MGSVPAAGRCDGQSFEASISSELGASGRKESEMRDLLLGMPMSLDGFVAGPNGSADGQAWKRTSVAPAALACELGARSASGECQRLPDWCRSG